MKKKRKKFNPLKYINGTKGAIALFMAVLMTPFLSIALLLVETGRYNSAVSVLDEALGVSSISTLANYDKYLQDRWGLLATAQDKDLTNAYSEVLNINSEVMGDSLTVNSLTVDGMYSLKDSDILYNQIMEYSKLNSPTKLATSFLNLKDVIGEFEKIKNIGDYISLLTSGVDGIDSTITLVKSANELKTLANELDSLKSIYLNDYTSFESSVNSLIDALNQPCPDSQEDSEGAAAYAKNIKSLRKNAKNAKEAYAATLEKVVEKLKAFKNAMEENSKAMKNIQNDIMNATSEVNLLKEKIEEKKGLLEDLNETIAEMEKEGYTESNETMKNALDYRAALETELDQKRTESGIAEATQQGLSNTVTGWQKSFQSYSNATIGATITGFEKLQINLKKYSVDEVSSSSSKITKESYQAVDLKGYISASDIDAYLKEQEQQFASGTLTSLINGTTQFFDSIIKMDLFYEPALSACIDVEYYNETIGGLPGTADAEGGVMSIISAIGSILVDIKNYKSNVGKLKFLKALESLKDLLKNIGELLSSIGKFALDVGTNIKDLLTNYDRIYYSTYSTFNLPCRTDYSGGSVSFLTMTNGSPSLPEPNISSTSVSVFDDLAALINTIKAFLKGSGNDITFNGAELEYILFGSNSEIANQLYVFVAIYLMRLLLDIPAIMANAEVQSLATASTFGYPVVMLLFILAEPLAETVLLVNGTAVPLYATTIYLSPSGLPALISQMISVCKITTEQSEQLKSGMVKAFGSTDDDYNYQRKLQEYKAANDEEKKSGSKYLKGLLSFNYREYCFFLLLLTVTDMQQMGRLSNLIQLETLYHYQKNGASFTFDLKNSYTCIDVQANISVKQMLPSLADSSLFTIDRQHYRGY